jgi:hypothetical protein
VADFGNGLEIRNIVARVANALEIHGFSLVINGRLDVFRLIASYEFGVDAEAWEKHLELIVGTACSMSAIRPSFRLTRSSLTIEITSGDNVVAGMGQRRNGQKLGSLIGSMSAPSHHNQWQPHPAGKHADCTDLSGRGRHGCNATFEGSNSLLENVHGRIHDTAVNVSKLLEAEQPRSVSRVIEGEGLNARPKISHQPRQLIVAAALGDFLPTVVA